MLAGRDAGTRGRDGLVQDRPRLGLGVALRRGQERLELLGHDVGDDPVGRRGAEHLLGLALELRLGQTYGDHCGEALQRVVLDDVVLGDAKQLGGAQRLVDRLGHGALESGHMGAALGGGDDVDERLEVGVVPGAPAQGDVDRELTRDLGRRHVTALVQDRHGLLESALSGQAQDVADRLVLGEVLAEFADAAVEAEGLLGLALAVEPAFVADDDREPRNEEGRLPCPLVERLQVELGVLEEDLPVRPVAHPGAGARLRYALALEQAVGRVERAVRSLLGEDPRDSAPEADRVRRAAAVDLDVQPGGERVDDGGADAVQTAGRGVGTAAELSFGVQLGHHDLDAGQARLGLDIDGDAPPVVTDLHGIVVVEDDLDVIAVTAQGLVDGIVDDLPEAVHETAAVGGPDVHPGALANRFEPLEYEQMPRGVVGTVSVCSGQQRSGRHGRIGGHAVRSSLNFIWGPVGNGLGFGRR